MLEVIELSDGSRLIVEISDTSDEAISDTLRSANLVVDETPRRPGAEPVSKRTKISNAGSLLSEQIKGLASLAQDAISNAHPQVVEIEAHIKFSSGVHIIPFLADASGEGGLKLKLTWKNE